MLQLEITNSTWIFKQRGEAWGITNVHQRDMSTTAHIDVHQDMHVYGHGAQAAKADHPVVKHSKIGTAFLLHSNGSAGNCAKDHQLIGIDDPPQMQP